MRRIRASALGLVVGLMASAVWPGQAAAQGSGAWGRVSFFTSASQSTAEGSDEDRSLAEVVTTLTYHSAVSPDSMLEFGVDGRFAGYTVEERDPRVSLYEAWAGTRLLDGALRLRVGNLWLTELGGLGAVGGGLAEYGHDLGHGRLRVAAFGGLEPTPYEAGYVSDVTRYGGYVAFDGRGALRSTLGYVLVRNGGLTERSVLSTTNYLPVGPRVFVYQAAEVDLQGPGSQGDGGLSYFFVNGRVRATQMVELQGVYHRGRSVDARTITQDQLNGRPVPPSVLEGLLFESWNGRVTLSLARGLRLYGGYGQDRSDETSDAVDRINVGGSASNLFGSGIDATVSLYRMDRGQPGSYDSWYASVGRSLGSRVYLTGDYTSSVSIVRFLDGDGILIESRPHTDRYSVTAIVNLTRAVSLLATGEHTADDSYDENRLLAGLTYRLH